MNKRPYAWQEKAFSWWLSNQCRGIVEAVTGTGKTLVGMAAMAWGIEQGCRVLLLVPTIVLMHQWRRNIEDSIPGVRIGLLGDGAVSADDSHTVLIAVINSASNHASAIAGKYRLIVADECHRYGAPTFRRALADGAPLRLGLTATLERNDDGVEEVLRPYFGLSFVYGYDEAMADGVLASFVVADVGVELRAAERAAFDEADEKCRKAMGALINQYGYPNPAKNFGDFMAKATAASKTLFTFFGEGKQAKLFLNGFSDRIRILAETPGRIEALQQLATCITQSGRTLVFTETVRAANVAATALQKVGVRAHAYHSEMDTANRETVLEAFRNSALQALVAVKALDEGVDVPDADLGIIMSASRSKRQMIQRLGRVVRRKADGRYARFAILFAEGTFEDPDNGGHEAFRGATVDAADEIQRFSPAESRQAADFLIAFGRRRTRTEAAGSGKEVEVIGYSAGDSEGGSSLDVVVPDHTLESSDERAETRQLDRASGIFEVACDLANGSLRIGSEDYELSSRLSVHQAGQCHDFRYRGRDIGHVEVTEGERRLVVRVPGVGHDLRWVNPPRAVQQAAIALAIAATEAMHQDGGRRQDR